jgi:flagellar basal-body rod protein FlgB
LDIGKIGYFSQLTQRMGLLNDRQRLLAENVANATTPRFVPRDVDMRAAERAASRGGTGGLRIAQTNGQHMAGSQAASNSGRVINRPDSETTLDGNAVVLEEQMIRVAETRLQFETAIGLYQKGLQMMRTATRRPGG